MDIEIINYDDVVHTRDTVNPLPVDQVRRATISVVVDTGAFMLVLPGSVVTKLGLPDIGKSLPVTGFDGVSQTRDLTIVGVNMLGRESIFDAIVEPGRDTALIGSLVLETLDFLVDPRNERVFPRSTTGRTCAISG